MSDKAFVIGMGVAAVAAASLGIGMLISSRPKPPETREERAVTVSEPPIQLQYGVYPYAWAYDLPRYTGPNSWGPEVFTFY
jgi:hypothetical protein